MAKILLIEDDPNQQLLFSDELEEDGHDVVVAENAVRALEIVKEVAPDLVVLDIQMPGMDGIEALQHLVGQNKKLPVILHTAYGTYKDNFMTWLAEAYVIKSSDLSRLKETIREVLAKRKGEDGGADATNS